MTRTIELLLIGLAFGAGAGVIVGYWLRFEVELSRRAAGTVDLTGLSRGRS